MKSKIVADGGLRLRKAREHEARQKIEAKYAEELAKASLIGRLAVRTKIEREVFQEIHRNTPSSQALYLARPFRITKQLG